MTIIPTPNQYALLSLIIIISLRPYDYPSYLYKKIINVALEEVNVGGAGEAKDSNIEISPNLGK